MSEGYNPLDRIMDQFAIDNDSANPSMRRDRPYTGQPWTHLGARGGQMVSGLTIRDLRDCFVRAYMLSIYDLAPQNEAYYREAEKGEDAALCEEDLYKVGGEPDLVAVIQNFACEIERAMENWPNVPKLTGTD